MKTLIKSTILLISLLILNQGFGQKVMNDPTYSENNYKHPNKAAYVKKQKEGQPVIYLQEVKSEEANEDNNMTSAGNYKGMSASKAKTKKFRATTAPEAAPYQIAPAGNGNYKQQFPARERRQEVKDKQTQEAPVAANE